jgi:cell division protein FtsN
MNENQKQLEMFNNYPLRHSEDAHSDIKKTNWLSGEFNLRKFIIALIIFIVINLLSFSVGVEKGLHLSMVSKDKIENAKNTEVIQNTQQVTKPLDVPVVSKKDNVVDKIDKPINKPKVEPSKKPPSDGEYSIQVASYRKNLQAEKEADTLRKKGYLAFVLKKGDYIVVCVGKFKDKTEASQDLNKLKKTYSDSYLRRI